MSRRRWRSLYLSLAFLLATNPRVVVMPFDNLSQGTEHAWVSEAFAEALTANLTAAGEDVVGLRERNQKLKAMGLPVGVPLTRATVIQLGQSLAARRAVVGSFRVSDQRIEVYARVLDLAKASMIGVIQDEGAFADLIRVQNQLSKNVLRLEGGSPPEAFVVSATRRRSIPREAYESYMKALLAEGEAQRALLESALALHPAYSEAKLLLGEAFLATGKARDAVDVLISIRPEDPFYRSAYFSAGLSYLEAGELDAAAQVFATLAEREGASVFYNNLGVTRFRAGELQEAMDDLSRAASARPELGAAFFNLGWIAWRSGKGAEALKWLREAVRTDPKDGEAYFLLGAAARAQALPDEAEDAQKKAIEISASYATLDASTIKGLERVVAVLPTSAPVLAADPVEGSLDDKVRYHVERARECETAGRREDAIRELERAVYLSPYSVAARLGLARLYRDAGDLQKAAGEARVILWNGDNVEAHVLLADVLLSSGQLDEARSHLDAVEKLEPSHPQLVLLREKLNVAKP